MTGLFFWRQTLPGMDKNFTSIRPLIYADGDMAERIRSFNWAATPLGAMEGWPVSLLMVVNQLLDSAFPMLVWWGEENIQLYNDACQRLQQYHPGFANYNALGTPGEVTWADLWPAILEKKELIFRTGKAVYKEDELIAVMRNSQLEDIHWTYSFDPVRNDDGQITGLLTIFKESSRIYRKLQQKEEEQAFLLKLSDQLQSWNSPEQIEAESVKLIAQYVNADRVGFAEAHEAEPSITIERSFVKQDLPDLTGTYSYADYGYGLYSALVKGQTVVRNNIPEDEGLDDRQKEAHAALQLGATVNIPLLKAGRLIAVFFVHCRKAHHWTSQEISLLEQSAIRIWNAVLTARSEQELKKSEKRYRTLFNSIDDAFMVIDFTFDAGGKPQDYRFLDTNPAFEKQTGLKNVQGKTILQIMPEIERTWIETYGNVALTGQALRFEEYNQGTGAWFDVYAVAVRESSTQVVVVFHDITERKLEEQRKNDFLSMASHELKTPLTSVNGYLHILRKKFLDGQDIKASELVERTTRQVNKMTSIINSFLNIARLDAGQIVIQRTSFDLIALVQEAVEDAANNIISHQFLFEPIGRTMVNADQDKINQVIENFISNAVKYSPPGSPIQLTCVNNGAQVTISVSDAGMGLKADDHKQVFKRFYRVENTYTHTIAGFGIGLFICKEIIDRHGGQIGVTSEAGKGSTFWFSLPVVSTP